MAVDDAESHQHPRLRQVASLDIKYACFDWKTPGLTGPFMKCSAEADDHLLAADLLKRNLGLEPGRKPSACFHAGSCFSSSNPPRIPACEAGTTSSFDGFVGLGTNGLRQFLVPPY